MGIDIKTIYLLAFFSLFHYLCSPSFNYEEEGIASFYHSSLEGRLTASGEPYRENALTAAHRSLPFGTKVLVHNLKNDRKVWVTINDRGPFVKNRVIDLSRSAADSLQMVQQGITTVIIKTRL